MGIFNSRETEPPRLKYAEIQEYSRHALFSPIVIEKLYCHFYRIASSEADFGGIDLGKLCTILHKNPGNSRILEGLFQFFDANKDGVINFREFVQCLSIFSKFDQLGSSIEYAPLLKDAKIKEQIGYTMRLLGAAESKKIYARNLMNMLSSITKVKLGIKLKDETIEAIAKQTIESEEFNMDEKGKYLAIREYSRMVIRRPYVLKWLAVDMERVMQDVFKKNSKSCKSLCLSL